MTVSKRPLKAPSTGEMISRNEILDVMADTGYPASQRKNWLMEVLMHVTSERNADASPEREALIEEIKQILREQVSEDSKSEDMR